MGIPEYEAKQYERKIKDGGILLSVHSRDSEEAKAVEEILEEGGATDVSSSSDAGAGRRAAGA
jgi:hypothetical protein